MEETASAAVDWTTVLLEYGPMAGGLIALSLIFGPILLVIAKGHDKAVKEAARLHGRALLSTSGAVEKLAKSQQCTALQIRSLRSSIETQDARFALRKARLAENGGTMPDDEKRALESLIAESAAMMQDHAIWASQDGEDEAPELEEKIRRLEDRIEFSSDRDERDRLWRQLQTLLQLREV